jgi:hypothetical protein
VTRAGQPVREIRASGAKRAEKVREILERTESDMSETASDAFVFFRRRGWQRF